MRIEVACRCGASAAFEDNDQRIFPFGEPDDQGRIFKIEVIADRWRDRHQDCLKTTETPLEVSE